jgi:integrase/recombinase XerD
MQKTPLCSAVSESSLEASPAPQQADSRPNHGQGSPSPISTNALTIAALERQAKDWLCDCQYRQHSSRTIETRRLILDKLLWFLREHEYTECGFRELRRFLVYLANGHESAGGRWNNPQKRKPVKPRTVHTWHGHLRTFFAWVVKEEIIPASPMERIAPPIFRRDQIQPFTEEQIGTLLGAARRSLHPRRDEAILLLLLDTGLRSSELCSIRHGDIEMDLRRVNVVGKGNKRRTVYFGRRAARALGQYLREQVWSEEQAVFCSDRGTRAGEALTRSGLQQLIERLGVAAGIQSTRCSPHTFRHTFAVSFLRNGGNVFTLQQMLGHTSLDMTNRYVAFAQADIENQHRQFSPADRIRG